ncbi:MAG: type 4a pilus biogenesis protein PilO [Deltaproteobacteria bacterium]|nr:type 4a pilus biogenesis protein PilO [Deltaproteobacteria bacterium]MCL5792819.1 type 4a pilus biogenesis protein PilO [Deltaproteobacteria bacterium]
MDINLNTLSKLTLQQKILLIGVIMILVVLLDLYLWPGYFAERNKLAVLKAQEQNIQAKVLETQAITAHLNEFQDELDKLNEQLKEALTKLPNTEEIDKYLLTINTLAKTTDINVLQIQPQAEQNKGFYAEIPVSINVTGRYQDIATFLDKLTHLQRIVNVSALNLKIKGQSSIGKTILNASFITTVFRFVEQKTNTTGKK